MDWSHYLVATVFSLAGLAGAWRLLHTLKLARREARWDRGLPPR